MMFTKNIGYKAIRCGALASLAALSFAAPSIAQNFRGAGFVTGFSEACAPSSPDRANWVHTPRVAYIPGEMNAGENVLTLDFTDGTIMFGTVRNFVPTPYFGGAWAQYHGVGWYAYRPRPRLRTVQRLIISPDGGTDISVADEVFLRMNIDNYWSTAGCFVTFVAVVVSPGGSNARTGDSAPAMAQASVAEMHMGAGATPPGQ